MMTRLALTLTVLLVFAAPVAAVQDEWTVYYLTRNAPGQQAHFFGDGSYMILYEGPVYVHQTDWVYIGQYGSTAPLPDNFPTISGLTPDTVAGVEHHVGMPEFSVLRRVVPRLPELHGRLLDAKLALRAGMQQATAWGTVGALRALGIPVQGDGVLVRLRAVTLEVTTWCAGTDLLKLLLGLAATLAFVLRFRTQWALALLAAAALVTLEANIIRVAAVAVTYDQIGRAAWNWKEVWGGTATALGILQVGVLAWAVRGLARMPRARRLT